MLEAHKGKFSPEDIRKLKYTTHLLITGRVLPDLFTAGAKVRAPSADLRDGLRILRRWDREASAKSKGAVDITGAEFIVPAASGKILRAADGRIWPTITGTSSGHATSWR